MATIGISTKHFQLGHPNTFKIYGFGMLFVNDVALDATYHDWFDVTWETHIGFLKVKARPERKHGFGGDDGDLTVTLEFDDLRSSRIRPRQPQRGLVHLRPRYTEADQLGARHDLLHAPSEQHFGVMLTSEELTPAEAVGDGADDRFRRVPQNIRAHAQCVVDVRVAIHVVQPRPGGTLEHQWHRLTAQPEVAVHAACQHLASFSVQPG